MELVIQSRHPDATHSTPAVERNILKLLKSHSKFLNKNQAGLHFVPPENVLLNTVIVSTISKQIKVDSSLCTGIRHKTDKLMIT